MKQHRYRITAEHLTLPDGTSPGRSEVMLQHCGHPLFADFAPHFKTFMQQLKLGPSARENT
ncbi:DUF3861 family protein [Roseateles sp. SL47]|uniref:DUF3861 family protein n=1 Tax=Roseateles sp. SL47 TaxID=2995138 RepID=UPI00226E8B78|nr:DUF3861 family protein [Roseateles sp. SL47]WAC74043.1 DUF3861 family protein [Roseateles sp. SL47]